MNKEIVLYGEQEGYIKAYPTLWDAYRDWQEIKKQNKEFKMQEDTYYWQFEYDTEKEHIMRPIKFYVRKGKMFYKFI